MFSHTSPNSPVVHSLIPIDEDRRNKIDNRELLCAMKNDSPKGTLSRVEMTQGLIGAFTQTPSEIVWWFGEFFQSKSQTEAVSELELALQLGVETFGVEVAMTMLGALSNLIFADYDGIFPDFQPETG